MFRQLIISYFLLQKTVRTTVITRLVKYAFYFSLNTLRLSESFNPKPNRILRRVAIRAGIPFSTRLTVSGEIPARLANSDLLSFFASRSCLTLLLLGSMINPLSGRGAATGGFILAAAIGLYNSTIKALGLGSDSRSLRSEFNVASFCRLTCNLSIRPSQVHAHPEIMQILWRELFLFVTLVGGLIFNRYRVPIP